MGKIDPSLSRPVAMATTSIMCRTILGGAPTEQSLNGLPKPWLTAGDDEAYGRFLRHPDPRILMTLDYFPHSVKLRKAADPHR